MARNHFTQENQKKWFSEEGSWTERHYYGVDAIWFQESTPFQEIALFTSTEYGDMLVIDGAVQSAADDEYIYHESLVHPGMIAHPNPKNILVIGAGEGASARELLKHPSVQYVTLVDIDERMITLAKEYLYTWHQGSFFNPKVSVVLEDGLSFIQNTPDFYDVIILDVCDEVPEGAANALYTEAFYRAVKQRLAPEGLLIIQAGECCTTELDTHCTIRQRLEPVFDSVVSYTTYVPSFWCEWGFIIASDSYKPQSLSIDTINQRIDERQLASKLDYYDGETHHRMVHLPKALRHEMQEFSTACLTA